MFSEFVVQKEFAIFLFLSAMSEKRQSTISEILSLQAQVIE